MHGVNPLRDQTLCPTCKGGAMPQFCLLFYAILQYSRPKGGPWHNAPPLNVPQEWYAMVLFCVPH